MSLNKINIVVAGATGYVGLDLVKILSFHERVNISYICAQKNIGKNIRFLNKEIKKNVPKISDLNSVKWGDIDILFLCLPDGEAQILIKNLFTKYKKLRFIDLSADFRLKKPLEYKKWYKKKHNAVKLIKHSIYSVAEFQKKQIKNYRIISNPGCYPTSIQLPLLPLIKNNLIKNDVIIDSKSGYSGAGKNFEKKFSHKNLFKSIFNYGVKYHKHMAELDQEILKIKKTNYIFIPQVIPTFRGILSTMHVELNKNVSIKLLHSKLNKYHKKNKFITVCKLNEPISTGSVLNTNRCLISICETRIKNKITIFSAIDNLQKGASGQAVQNMNILFNFKENLGLK